MKTLFKNAVQTLAITSILNLSATAMEATGVVPLGPNKACVGTVLPDQKLLITKKCAETENAAIFLSAVKNGKKNKIIGRYINVLNTKSASNFPFIIAEVKNKDSIVFPKPVRFARYKQVCPSFDFSGGKTELLGFPTPAWGFGKNRVYTVINTIFGVKHDYIEKIKLRVPKTFNRSLPEKHNQKVHPGTPLVYLQCKQSGSVAGNHRILGVVSKRSSFTNLCNCEARRDLSNFLSRHGYSKAYLKLGAHCERELAKKQRGSVTPFFRPLPRVFNGSVVGL